MRPLSWRALALLCLLMRVAFVPAARPTPRAAGRCACAQLDSWATVIRGLRARRDDRKVESARSQRISRKEREGGGRGSGIHGIRLYTILLSGRFFSDSPHYIVKPYLVYSLYILLL